MAEREPGWSTFRRLEKAFKHGGRDRRGVLPAYIDIEADHESAYCREKGLCRHEDGVWTIDQAPGLLVIPNALTALEQADLLRCVCYDYMCQATNRTNLHAHYALPYDVPGGLWRAYSEHGDDITVPSVSHLKPATLTRLLERKLRWITLGEQYDWTRKEYPDEYEKSPKIPRKLASVCSNIARRGLHGDGEFDTQTAIVNFYCPGDTLTAHVDVSEHDTSIPLVSISLGLSCIFLMGGRTPDDPVTAIKLASGTAIIMTGESRLSYHGVPLVLAGTFPSALCGGEDGDDECLQFFGKGRRVNINVRTVRAAYPNLTDE